MERPLIIYHAHCPDGFGAACAAYLHFCPGGENRCDFVAAAHGDPPPPTAGREVYMVDFSYPRLRMKELCPAARSVTVIDHHVTAQRELAGLEEEYGNLRVLLNMEKSGAVLAWEYFHATPPPRLLLHVQDRDLWRFEMAATNDVYAALMARPFEFDAWRKLLEEEVPPELLAEGRAINRYRRQMIDLHREKACIGSIAGFKVPVVNCYEDIASDLLGELAKGHPFAAGYQDQGSRRKWSLRSSASGEDVAVIAERFGGGGHRNAAGFITRIPETVLSAVPRRGE